MTVLNETHDPALRSWVASAKAAGTDFPIQNLPFAVFRRRGSAEAWRGGVAIGDQVLDLAAGRPRRVQRPRGRGRAAAAQDKLNALMALGAPAWSALRLALSRAARGAPEQAALQPACWPRPRPNTTCRAHRRLHRLLHLGAPRHQHRPAVPPDNPLLPNYKWVPIGYHGRASSIGVSGQRFHRPQGQTLPPGASAPTLGPCKRLDIELELGVFVGRGNALGEPVPITRPRTMCSASACSTTGRRATSRPGNTSRWGPSCPRTSPPPSRPGW
jgi:fumarylacetoacetase